MKIGMGDKVKIVGHVFGRKASGKFHLIANQTEIVRQIGRGKTALVELPGRKRRQPVPKNNLEKLR